jgi:hypothetical protein
MKQHRYTHQKLRISWAKFLSFGKLCNFYPFVCPQQVFRHCNIILFNTRKVHNISQNYIFTSFYCMLHVSAL